MEKEPFEGNEPDGQEGQQPAWRKKLRTNAVLVVLVLAAIGAVVSQLESWQRPKGEPALPALESHFQGPLPVPGMVTMVDLGADACIPCKLMAPILAKLEKAYADKAAIVFIDVWKDRQAARQFGIRIIPTQIFYDENGREVLRHEGFLDEKSIVEQLGKLGVRPPAGL
ncbi:MAG: thioredoxin family protein [Desulfatibacillaceae bacterium]|nr:thioredoxin family protein [Desulfatibacillaceae bacterium]